MLYLSGVWSKALKVEDTVFACKKQLFKHQLILLWRLEQTEKHPKPLRTRLLRRFNFIVVLKHTKDTRTYELYIDDSCVFPFLFCGISVILFVPVSTLISVVCYNVRHMYKSTGLLYSTKRGGERRKCFL